MEKTKFHEVPDLLQPPAVRLSDNISLYEEEIYHVIKVIIIWLQKTL